MASAVESSTQPFPSVFLLLFSSYSPSFWYVHLSVFVVTSVFSFLTPELSSSYPLIPSTASHSCVSSLMRSSCWTSSLLSFSLASFVRSSDFPASAFRCPWSIPRAVRLFVVLSPSPSDVFREHSTRSPDLPENLGNNPSRSSLCFGIPYTKKLMQLVFICPNANSAKSHHSVFVGFVFQYDACRRKFFLQSASSISLSIQKVIRWLPSHNPTRPWPHPYSASYEGRPVRCFGPNDCVVHNSGIEPRTFQTMSFHQTLAVSEYTSVSLRLSSSCRVRRPKQLLIRAWFGDFVDFFLDSFGVHVEPNQLCISLCCFVYAWPKIWDRWAYFWVECFGLRRSFRLRKMTKQRSNASSVSLTNHGLPNAIYYKIQPTENLYDDQNGV